MKNTPRIVASSIRPLFGHVVVRAVVPGDENRPPVGEVLSRAPDVGDEIQVGTMVLYHSSAMARFPSLEGEIRLLSEREIYGILPEKDAKPLIDWHRDDPGPKPTAKTRTSSASAIVAKVDALVSKLKRSLHVRRSAHLDSRSSLIAANSTQRKGMMLCSFGFS